MARELLRELQPQVSGGESGDIHVVAAHQLTPEMAELVSRAERVLFVDAARRGQPGSLLCSRVAPVETLGRYSHELSPATVLKLAEQLYGRCPPAWLLTIAGENFETGDAMSLAVVAALPALKAQVRRFVDGGEMEIR